MTDPRWWHEEHDDAWSHARCALARASDDEVCVRYGVGARLHYGIAYPEWDDRIEAKMRDEWTSLGGDRPWFDVRDLVRQGWDVAVRRVGNAA